MDDTVAPLQKRHWFYPIFMLACEMRMILLSQINRGNKLYCQKITLQDPSVIYADVVSDCSDHSGSAAIECMEQILDDEEINDIFSRKTEVEWRFDACSDNLNAEMLHWTMLNLPRKFPNIQVVKSSPYVNREGKSISDIHFSRVDVAEIFFINSGKGMFTPADMLEAVNLQIKRDQVRRQAAKLSPINWKIFSIKMECERTAEFEVCKIYGIQSTFGLTYIVKDKEMWNHFNASAPHTDGYKVNLKRLCLLRNDLIEREFYTKRKVRQHINDRANYSSR